MHNIERNQDVPANEVAVRNNNAEQPKNPRAYLEPMFSDGTCQHESFKFVTQACEGTEN